MLKKIAIAILVLVVVILGFAATKPDTFQVQRSITMKTAPEKAFALINDFHQWESWSPWEKMDLTMKKKHSGTESGKGAIYEWEGNDKVGKGRMEITHVSAPNEVHIQLDFIKPFECKNEVDFTLSGQGDTTNVTWNMHGPSPYFSKLMQVFMSMDSMVGKDFETGLANLKNVAEK